MIRNSIVDGQFYPSDATKISKVIKEFGPREGAQISAKGIILPHAGYPYSGKVAITTVAKVLPKKKLLMLGPNHTGLGASFGLWDRGAWKTPLGQIEIDQDLAKVILDAGNSIRPDYLCHQQEHSIEVELPIIQHFFKEFKFVPIACKISNIQTYKKVAEQIVEAVKGDKENLLMVASTDLTHYESDSVARKKDREAIEAIINLDEKDLLQKVDKFNITMCGVAPVVVLILCLKKLGAKKSQVALYQTSGDVCGDKESVVGYVGIIIK